MCDEGMGIPPASTSIADKIARRLQTFLGPHNAKIAVKTFSLRALGRPQETLTPEDLPALLQAMRPMLRTLVGEDSAEALLASIEQEVNG